MASRRPIRQDATLYRSSDERWYIWVMRTKPYPFDRAVVTPSVFPDTVSASADRHVSLSKITYPPEARTFAETHGARDAVEVSCELALEMVPAADHVDVKVICDPEDAEYSLHATVRTSADADEVVEAEECLYDALFDRIEPAAFRLLSLGYDFRG